MKENIVNENVWGEIKPHLDEALAVLPAVQRDALVLRYLTGLSEAEAALLVNPLPVTAAVLERGRRCFQVRCALCHGPLGHGQGSLGPAYGAQPADLHTEAIRAYPDGRLYWTLVMGKDAMPGQGKELDHDQRWAVVHYLRALQRAQQARPEDLP